MSTVHYARLRAFKRKIAALLLVSMCLSLLTTLPPASATPVLEIVTGGQSRAIVVVESGADQQIRNAGSKVVDYVYKATGATLPVMTKEELALVSGPQSGFTRIYIGPQTDLPVDVENALIDLDDDGYVLFSDSNEIVIGGNTAWGIEFGVDEFLERYVGVLWLLPGPDGEDVPQTATLSVPADELIREQPVSISREFSGLRGPLQTTWARNNRMHARVQFHHNMHQLFAPSVFGQTHPEFYPLKNGQLSVPTGTTGWQPCFSDPNTVTAAIYRIIDYFQQNPQQETYSLGVNDSSGYCEQQPTHPNYPNKLNSRGVVDMSDIYYNWVNQVVEGVLDVYPDKYFGLLAYVNVYDPPSFPLNSRVIPFITDDRFAWADEDYAEEAQQIVEAWHDKASQLGFYEYMWGSWYTVPRVYMTQMADNYRYGEDQGVIAHYAELYPNWGEGPKPWVSLKLQWNPELDEQQLLEEWYERAVGPAAASDLADYYELWEDFWNSRVFESDWYKAWVQTVPRGNYANLRSTAYLKLVTDEDIAESRSLLESVYDKAVTAPQKARAQLLLDAFEYYESSALSYPKGVVVPTPANEQDALDLLDDALTRVELSKRRLELANAYKTDPLLQLPGNPTDFSNYENWSGMDGDKLTALVDYMKQEPVSGAVRQQTELLAQSTTEPRKAEYARLLLKFVDDEPSLAANDSFEDGTGTLADDWFLWVNQGVGTMQRTQQTVHSGTYAVTATGVATGSPTQVIPITQPGPYSASVYYYSPTGTQSAGTIQLKVNLRDDQEKNLLALYTYALPVRSTAGRWSWLEYRVDIPAQINGKAVVSAQFAPYVNGFSAGEQVLMDDAKFYSLSD